MTAKHTRNMGLIGTSVKDGTIISGVPDLISARLYQSASNDVTVYGIQGSVTHASHNSKGITGTINLGTAHSDRVIYLVVGSMNVVDSGETSSTTELTTSATIASNSMDIIFTSPAISSTATNSIAFDVLRYVDNGALGTSASYDIDFFTSCDQIHSGVVAFTTGRSDTAVSDFKARSQAGFSSSLPVDIPTGSGGFVLAMAMAQNATFSSGDPFTGFTGTTFDTGTGEFMAVGYVADNDGTDVSVPAANMGSVTEEAVVAAISRSF
jgi:hypothetical protein